MSKLFRSIIFCLLFITLAFSAVVPAQQDPPEDEGTISIDATLVTVPVIVSDRQGRYISGLKAEDFTLYEDHVKQSIAFFDASEEPLNVAILLDTSKSTRDVLPDIQDAAVEFLHELRPQDKAIVIGFDYELHVLSQLTSDRRALAQAIDQAYVGDYAGTKLNDAINLAARQYLSSLKGRKAIVLLTDGKDHGSRISAPDLLESINETNALVYSIFYTTGDQFNNRRGGGRNGNRRFGWPGQQQRDPYRTPGQFPGQYPGQSPDQYPGGQRRRDRMDDRGERRQDRMQEKNEEAVEFLTELADATAGRIYRSEITDLNQTFKLIADELRHQYQLGFYPESDREVTHDLKVQVMRRDSVVRARHSYNLNDSGKPKLLSPKH